MLILRGAVEGADVLFAGADFGVEAGAANCIGDERPSGLGESSKGGGTAPAGAEDMAGSERAV